MASAKFVIYLTCWFLWKVALVTDQKFSSSQHQENRFVSANVGESLTLPCFYNPGHATRVYWYKQSLGQKPRLMSTQYAFTKNATFYDEFNNNPRFTLDTETGKNHLTITDLRISDSASYHCARRLSLIIDFFEHTVVSVKGSGLNNPALVHQSVSETIQPGGSVTLNCTVHTGTCDEEHIVYWFKASRESSPYLIYTHGDRNSQCEKKPETNTEMCYYNLPIKNLNVSHAGTYYCAVASCGQILFGNKTKLDFEDNTDPLVLVYFLSGSLTFTTILVVLLAFLLRKIQKKNRFSESKATEPSLSTTSAEGYRDADNLHYAALSVNLPYRSRRQRSDTNSECVYSRVKL